MSEKRFTSHLTVQLGGQSVCSSILLSDNDIYQRNQGFLNVVNLSLTKGTLSAIIKSLSALRF